MISKLWPRGRRAAFAGVLAVSLLAVGGAVSPAATGVARAGASTGPVAGNAQGTAVPAGVGALRQAGPGWELAQYTTRTSTKHGPTTLYLISPGGTRYALYTWRSSATWAPHLIAWSGDKTRALLATGVGQYEQITLATGAVSHFTLAGHAQAIGYTRPSGQNILGFTLNGRTGTIARYSLTGKLVKVLTRGTNQYDAIYSADGTVLGVSGAKGIELVSNAGGVIRQLPIPGTDPRYGAYPVRWWNARTILAYSTASGKYIPRLWLVPVSGARPVPLTPQRTSPVLGDFGDVGAWQLPSGLYVQGVAGCGGPNLYRQAANGSITRVAIPHTTGSAYVATAAGARLLIQAQTGCDGSNSLLWFNPGTHAEQWLLRAPATAYGVTSVVPYYTRENAQ